MRFAFGRIQNTRGFLRVGLGCVLAALVLVPAILWAGAPAWWTERGVLNPAAAADDYAAVNQGQVKNIAKQGYEEIKSKLGSAGATLDSIWANPAASTDDYRAINLGQLKNVAKPFYDQLISVGYTTQYPWAGSTAAADDYALANIGQVKNLFSFDLSSFSVAGASVIIIESGDQQTGPSGVVLPGALKVLVSSAQGLPVNGASVTFTVITGTGTVAATSGGTGTATVTVTTGLLGQAMVYFKPVGSEGAINRVSAGIAQGSVAFQEYVVGSVASSGGNAAAPDAPTADTPQAGGNPSATVYYAQTTNPSAVQQAVGSGLVTITISNYDPNTYTGEYDEVTAPTLQWPAVEGFDHYIVQKRINLGNWSDDDDLLPEVEDERPSLWEASDSGLVCGNLYEYRIVGVTAEGARAVVSVSRACFVPMIKQVDVYEQHGSDVVDYVELPDRYNFWGYGSSGDDTEIGFGISVYSYLDNHFNCYTVSFNDKAPSLSAWSWVEYTEKDLSGGGGSDAEAICKVTSTHDNPSAQQSKDVGQNEYGVVVTGADFAWIYYRGAYIPAYALSGLSASQRLPLDSMMIDYSYIYAGYCGNPASDDPLQEGLTVDWNGGGIAATIASYNNSTGNYAAAAAFESGQQAYLRDHISFFPSGGSLTNNGTATITVTPVNSALQGASNSFPVQVGPAPDGPGVNIPASESSGAKYRKIALNGAPLSDEKPQHASESDQQSEETFIDALTLGLRHDTTDIYTSVPAADLSLSVRRSAATEIWNLKNGMRPEERADRPFGPGWTTNLAANIHFTHMVGEANEDGSNPDTATVTDENGAEYTFAVLYGSDATYTTSDGYTGSRTFVPLPSSNHEQGIFLCTLTANLDGSYTFKRKFGATLTYSMSGLAMGFAADRIKGSNAGTNHTYARLDRVQDRYGNQLDYTYSSMFTVVPATIAVHKANGGGTTLSIRQDSAGHITDIWDPNGYKVHYDYGMISHSSVVAGTTQTVACMVMHTVTAADGKQTHYTYDISDEGDQNPSTTANVGNYYHLDLTGITDPLNHTYAFTYGFDQSKYDYSSDNGYYIKSGLPAQVRQTTLPDGTHAAFLNLSQNLKVVNDNGVETMESDYVRKNSIIDALGNQRDYDFTNPRVEELPSFATAYKHEVKFDNPRMVYYQTMTITPYTGAGLAKVSLGGTETFTFDPAAGMSATSATDFSGNTTTYAYGDSFAGQSTFSAAGASGNLYSYCSDPTSQTNALNKTKHFTYGANRIMTSSTDEVGVKTEWTVDSLGRRTEEKIFPAGSGAPIQDTVFAYDNPDFPNFLTKKTVKKLASADPAWVTDLVTTYVPDANGRLAQEITDPGAAPHLNLVTAYTYDLNGNKLTSTDPRGNVTTFSYDQRNRLVAVTYADHSQKQFFYDARGNKTEEIDENGVASFWQYDALNRVTTHIVDMDGSLKTAALTTHALTGTEATYRATHLHLVTSYTYNLLNAKLTVTDPRGTVTKFEYDALQRLTKKTDDFGHINYVTTYAYDLTKNPGGSVFDSSGFKPTGTLDARGYHTTVTYDKLYRPVTEQAEYQTGTYATTTKTYDDVGNLLTVTDPLGTATVTTYDALRRPTTVIEAYGTALSATTTKAYTSTGFAWQVIDPLGRETDTAYDAAGRPVTVTAPAVADALNNHALTHPVTQTLYDAAGNVSAVINPLGRRTDYTYDTRNRRVTEQLPAVTDVTTGQTSRPTRTTAYDLVGSVIAVQDARGFITSTTYDPARRPLTVTAPPVALADGTVTNPVTTSTYDLAGNVLTLTDPNHHTVTNTYDALNRLLTTRQQPTANAAADITVTNAYDPAGNRTDVWDGKGQHTQFAYDGLNRNTAITDPANHAVTYVYDALNKTDRVDALNQHTTYTYDARHRLTAVAYAGRTQDNRAYAYDLAGQLLTVTEPGKSGKADVAYTYDDLGRQLTETSGSRTHAYAYDLAGNRVTVTYGGTDTVLTSTYDALNRLSTLSETPALSAQLSTLSYPRVTTYGYDLNGNRAYERSPNGDTVQTRFDALNRSLAATHAKATGALLLQVAQAYDAAGNVTRVTEQYFSSALQPRTLTNTYDGANRLLTETAVQGATTTATAYTYDAAHNRAQKAVSITTGATNTTTGTTYAYNNLNQLLTATTGATVVSYTYDLNGNRQTRVAAGQTDTYSYDYENRLVSFDRTLSSGLSALSCAYTYDYRTRRVERSETTGTATTVTRSVFSGGLSVSEWVGAAVQAEFVRGSDWGGGVGGLLYSVRSGQAFFDHYNSRGDVVTQTDATGAATWQASYEAFGTRTQEVGSTQDRQKANTKEEDPTGLLNEGFRYRDLETGAFITRDPLGFVDGPNMYAYVVQNPWSKFDPEGLFMGTNLDAGEFSNVAVSAAVQGYARGGDFLWNVTVGGAIAAYKSGNEHTIAAVDSLQHGDASMAGLHTLAAAGEGAGLLLGVEGAGKKMGTALAKTEPAAAANLDAKVTAKTTTPAPTASAPVAPTTPPAAPPAHPTFEPGPYAGDSIPARSPAQTFATEERIQINQIGKDTGCHTCGTTNPGTKSGNFVPDHQPVSALNTTNAPQQLYPQCITCSREQGLAAARAKLKTQQPPPTSK
jgi:RHS repeat-associated protein